MHFIPIIYLFILRLGTMIKKDNMNFRWRILLSLDTAAVVGSKGSCQSRMMGPLLGKPAFISFMNTRRGRRRSSLKP